MKVGDRVEVVEDDGEASKGMKGVIKKKGYSLVRILLVEPDYRNKYPPLGLMKLSAYHKRKGDNVVFVKGFSPEIRAQSWDRIYVATLFTFYWSKTIKTIKYYLKCVKHEKNFFLGGVMATLMKTDIIKELCFSNITVVEGLLNVNGKLRYSDDGIIDSLTPDYSIIDCEQNECLDYIYPTKDSYITYATRGCIRKCSFCAVPKIEPIFHNGLSIKKQINAIQKKYGVKKNLLLMDNNILASADFDSIIDEIKESGFAKGDKYFYESHGRKIGVKRIVDFNQGVDARLLNEKNMKRLSEIAIEPLRIAFDDIKYEKIYTSKILLAAKYGIRVLSNYILFNFKDTPEDFYKRLRINVDLNEMFQKKGVDSRIWSFPMKYSPLFGEQSKTRKHIGDNWNKKYLRAIQCILIPTHGVVGPRREYFEKAFGKNVKEFKQLLLMPEHYIINRGKKTHARDKLLDRLRILGRRDFNAFYNIVKDNPTNGIYKEHSGELRDILKHYVLKV